MTRGAPVGAARRAAGGRGVGFLSPLFLAGILAAAIPIALHLYRRQAGPVVPFSAVRFVPRVPLHRTRRRRLQDVLLLALRVAALVLLAVSFARPYLAAVPDDRQAPLAVIAIDRSFSMSSPGRIEEARELARSVVDELGAGELAAVVAFDERAEVLQAPTTDRSAVRGAIAAVTSGFAATRYDSVLARTGELADGRRARLVIVSDLQRTGWPEGASSGLPESVTIDVRPVGAPPGNLLVAAVGAVEQGIAAEIRSSAADDRAVVAALSIDGRAALEQRVVVPALGAVDVTFPVARPARGVAAVRIEDETGYAADNVRYAVLDPPRERRLLAIVSPGGEAEAFYLRKAITAADRDGALVVDVRAADAIGARAGALDGYEAVIVLGSRGFDARAGAALGEALDRGCGLVLVAGPGLDWPWLTAQLPPRIRLRATGVETADAPVALAATDIRHPVFRASRTDSGWVGTAQFRRMLRLAPDGAARVLAQFTNGAPALVELDSGQARVLAFASDLSNQWNDFAVQPAFVPFVDALVQHVASGRPAVGEMRVGARPDPLWAQPGVIVEPGADGGRIAVNVDLRESDGAQLTPAAFESSVLRHVSDGGPARKARAREAEQSWWWYGLLVMLGGLVIESAAGRGRRAGAEA